MTNYFASLQAKTALTGNLQFSVEDARPDLLRVQYGSDRDRVMTPNVEKNIEALFKKWCDLLFSGHNVVVTGPNSKYSLLETFKKRYLDSGKLPNWNSQSLEQLNVVTIRLHGLDPIKIEAFNHAVFNIKETRRVKESDYYNFNQMVRGERAHFVFLIHSFEYFIDACEAICEIIFKLCYLNPEYVHIITSSDHWNGRKRLQNLQHNLRTIYTLSVLPGIDSFLWEKTELMDNFDYNDVTTADTTMHRLFADKTDLQSLKDIYQALDSATQKILTYVVKDLIDKTESISNDAAASSKKRFRGIDAEDDEEHELKEEDKADDKAPMRLRRTNNNNHGRNETNKTSSRRSRAPKSIGTHLDFQHLLKYCESQFIVRRGAALRDHLGELKDHKLVSFEDAGNKVQCLIDVDIGKKFLAWISDSA